MPSRKCAGRGGGLQLICSALGLSLPIWKVGPRIHPSVLTRLLGGTTAKSPRESPASDVASCPSSEQGAEHCREPWLHGTSILRSLFSRSVASKSFRPHGLQPISWGLLKLMPIELVMPSNHLILCRRGICGSGRWPRAVPGLCLDGPGGKNPQMRRCHMRNFSFQ